MPDDGPLLFAGWSPLSPAASRRSRPRRPCPERAAARPAAATHVVALEDGVVDQARELAEQLLSTVDDDGRRWRHTQAVAARAAEGAAAVAPEQVDVLLCAAWLHDLGHAPVLVDTGFHPLDGARHLQRQLWHPSVAGLVAHHSAARYVAAVRQLQRPMAPFERQSHWSGPVADALTWADQTTGPDGARTSVHERMADVLERHGPTSPQARCHAQRGPALLAAVRATEERLRQSGRADGQG